MSDRFTSNTNAVKVDDYFRWDAMVAYQQPKWGRPAQRVEPHQPARLRRADPVGPRPLGAGDQPAGAARVQLQVPLTPHRPNAMLLRIPNMLNPDQVRMVRERLDECGRRVGRRPRDGGSSGGRGEAQPPARRGCADRAGARHHRRRRAGAPSAVPERGAALADLSADVQPLRRRRPKCSSARTSTARSGCCPAPA